MRYEIQRAQNYSDNFCYDVVDNDARTHKRFIAESVTWQSAAQIADALNQKVASHVR